MFSKEGNTESISFKKQNKGYERQTTELKEDRKEVLLYS